MNAFTLWPRDQVEITTGVDKVGSYRKTPQIERKWCTVCGGHLLTDILSLGLVDALPMNDGLPKYRDFPKELGGSGILLTE